MLPPDFIIAIISCKTASYAILPQFRAFVNTGAYRIRSGNDRDADSRAAGRSISIHAPRRGSDKTYCFTAVTFTDFNPRSPQGERLYIFDEYRANKKFQSTLPAGGATLENETIYTNHRFQSTLPAGGATDLATAVAYSVINISIHAPRRGSDGDME